MVQSLKRGDLRRIFAVALLLALVTGCTPASESEVNSAQPPAESESASPTVTSEPKPLDLENQWFSRCASYEPLSGQAWHLVYNEVIADICSNTTIEPNVLEVIYSPGVNQDRLKDFIETAEFSFNYWRPKTLDTAPVKLILLNEQEREWFESTLAPLVKDPGVLEWFGPDAQGVGRCWSIGPDAACGAKYPVWETTTGTLVYVTLLGTRRVPDDEFNLDAAHNAVHWYQDSHGWDHWDYGFLEGQATVHEIAFHILLTGSDKKREDGAWTVFANDPKPFKATTVEETIKHHNECRPDSNQCHHHFYFGGAMQQEKIILDFGYPKYLQWLTEVESVESREAYEATFRNVFGVELPKWRDESWAPYLLESFLYYRENRWGE